MEERFLLLFIFLGGLVRCFVLVGWFAGWSVSWLVDCFVFVSGVVLRLGVWRMGTGCS